MSIVDDAFESLLYGSGSIIGILLIITISVALMIKWKYAGALIVAPLSLLEYEYYTRLSTTPSLAVNMVITLISIIFIAIYTMVGLGKR